LQESNKLITFSALRLPCDLHHIFLLPLDRISSGYSQSCVGHINRLSAAVLPAAYSSVVTGALIEHLRRAANAGLTGYTTAMAAAQTISSGGTVAAHVNRGVSLALVHCAIFCSYRNGIQDESDERI